GAFEIDGFNRQGLACLPGDCGFGFHGMFFFLFSGIAGNGCKWLDASAMPSGGVQHLAGVEQLVRIK
ncbi:MAG: hypothetical protein ACWA6Y_14110, partial [Polaromonas sp.]